MRYISFISSIVLLCGCVSQPNIDIQTTKPWEGHFMSKQEAVESIGKMELQKKESVWIMSNDTLFRLLENYKIKIENQK